MRERVRAGTSAQPSRGPDDRTPSDRQLDLIPTLLLALLGGGHFIDEFLELTRVLEVPVHGGIADVRHTAQWREPLHHTGALESTRDLAETGLDPAQLISVGDDTHTTRDAELVVG